MPGVNRTSMRSNQNDLSENHASIVHNQGNITFNQGSIVHNKGDIVTNRGSIVHSQSNLAASCIAEVISRQIMAASSIAMATSSTTTARLGVSKEASHAAIMEILRTQVAMSQAALPLHPPGDPQTSAPGVGSTTTYAAGCSGGTAPRMGSNSMQNVYVDGRNVAAGAGWSMLNSGMDMMGSMMGNMMGNMRMSCPQPSAATASHRAKTAMATSPQAKSTEVESSQTSPVKITAETTLASRVAAIINKIVRTAYLASSIDAAPVMPGAFDEDAPDSHSTTSPVALEMLCRMFVLSTEQMWNELLAAKLDARLDNTWSSNIDDADFDDMSSMEKIDMVELLSKRWVKTSELLSGSLLRHGEFLKQGGMEHFMQRFAGPEAILRASSGSSSTKPVLDFFVAFSTLISDTVHLLTHDSSPNLLELKDMPTRATILARILDSAPMDIDLAPYTRDTLIALPDVEQDCGICHEILGDKMDIAAIGTLLHESIATPEKKEWIALSADRRGITVKEGFEGVPLRMACGDVFCAGCVATWMEKEGRLMCPMGDQEYGVHRSAVVKDMEFLREACGGDLDG